MEIIKLMVRANQLPYTILHEFFMKEGMIMEKDYFKDRTKESTSYQAVRVGSYVYICTKDKQRTAKTIHDLRLVKVTAHLTKQSIHPRGQKIKGVETATGKTLVGRVVYLTENGKLIITQNGSLTVSEWYDVHNLEKNSDN
ncbi:hypothetical protein [Anaerostipes sp.]|uniref:hypothetical protein n=1 Tax=Anaerostipes sp. TaxID=1872530 RepID=UPI0025BE39C1|nr:hypothetical protein [Anaerostipes sp.]MBS7009256.1 hypothetical protein [Anaerostipes sp.]